jgi:hypothetical protein
VNDFYCRNCGETIADEEIAKYLGGKGNRAVKNRYRPDAQVAREMQARSVRARKMNQRKRKAVGK